jgi:glyoxylase-like metal-dependent hydrolase (beta-lactamase superfamily II)
MRQWTTENGLLVHRLVGPGCNVYLVSGPSGCIMVDSSYGFTGKKLLQRVELACAEKQLKALVLTHTHFDHAGNAALIKEHFKLPIVVHEEEAGYLKKGISPLPRGTQFYNKAVMNMVRRVHIPFQHFKAVRGDILINDRYDFSEYGLNAYALPTPGHTKGSLSVVVDNTIALVGDTLVGYVLGHNYPAFADGPDQFVASWAALLDTGCTTFLPTHGGAIKREALQVLLDKHL